ncbi:MAG: DUF3990 domain-containing protein [Eubacterium sp.]|nr:DUF3990 domain-containing protein [Eubacterium sp.]
MILYHTGFLEIRQPDIYRGRKNADFGQGFYLTADQEFARRWAKDRDGEQVILNTYELDTEGLRIQEFCRDEKWFAYISGNRAWEPDASDADVIIGPIANDTIYDTFGIITSGVLAPEEAMRLLMIGPEYRQIALKTEKAASRLKWLSAEVIETGALKEYRETVLAEQTAYQKELAEALEIISPLS